MGESDPAQWKKLITRSCYKRCSENTARFLKDVWSFYNIIHERVNFKTTNGQTYIKEMFIIKGFASFKP